VESFYFYFSFFLAVCVLNVLTSSGCYVGAEAGCNRYLLDINIFPLSKEKRNAVSYLMELASSISYH
jgi:hypothetical protein